MKKWVEEHVSSQGYDTTDAFFIEMLQREKTVAARERLEKKLLAAVNSGKSTPMTSKDWERIRAAGLKRARELRKK